jgi:hypothetical protein
MSFSYFVVTVGLFFQILDRDTRGREMSSVQKMLGSLEGW